MCKNEEAKALSKVELILPANVVEACWNLKKTNQAFFFAVNEHDKTSSEINIHKLSDNSVKIRVTVFPLTDNEEDEEGAGEEQSSQPQDSEMEPEPPTPSPIIKGPTRGRPPKQQIKVESPRGKSPRAGPSQETPEPGKRTRSAAATPAKGNKKGEDDARVQFVHHDDDEQDYVVDETEEQPRASTIIIVKGPGSDDEEEKEELAKTQTPASKKDRIHTTTTASGKQIIYKTRTKRREVQAEAEKKQAAEAKTPKSKEQQFMDNLALNKRKNKETADEEPSPPAKKANPGRTPIKQEKDKEKGGKISKVWKAIGVGEERESGDVIITAESLRSATEGFQMNVNDKEYNFEVEDKTKKVKQPVKKLTVQGITTTAVGTKKRRASMPETKSQKVWCMICGKTLLNYSYLYRHVRQFHKDIQDVDQYLEEIKPLMKTPCPLCHKEISSMSNMSSHIQQCHPDTEEPYQCEVCMGFYKTRISLKHHMQSQHSESRKVWPCKYCGATFTETRSLKEHVNCTHETTEVFTCDVCHKTFLTRGRLRRHMYIHGEFRLFCKYCGKGFHLKDNMNKHIDLIHEKKNQYRFKCEYCSKAFNVKGNLLQHVNGVHLKTLPYRCPICDMGWRKKSLMLSHMKEHAVKGGKGKAAKYVEEDESEDMDDTMDESSIADEGAAVNQTI